MYVIIHMCVVIIVSNQQHRIVACVNRIVACVNRIVGIEWLHVTSDSDSDSDSDFELESFFTGLFLH